MNVRTLVLFLVFSSSLSAQSFLSNVIPGFDALDKPQITKVNVTRTDSSIRFAFHGSEFSITQSGDLVEPLITARKGATAVDRQLLEASPFFPDVECTVVSFDADRNGVNDLFVVFPYGISGRNANIEIIASYFFFPDSSMKFVKLRTYYGDTDLFRDYTHDGRYEFACINYVGEDSVEYDAVNLFSVKDGVFTNISRKTLGFPVFVKRADSESSVIKQLPSPMEKSWYLEKPDALLVNNPLTN
jgi:hypothetical protein